mgnify:CR=1 FL=1
MKEIKKKTKRFDNLHVIVVIWKLRRFWQTHTKYSDFKNQKNQSDIKLVRYTFLNSGKQYLSENIYIYCKKNKQIQDFETFYVMVVICEIVSFWHIYGMFNF